MLLESKSGIIAHPQHIMKHRRCILESFLRIFFHSGKYHRLDSCRDFRNQFPGRTRLIIYLHQRNRYRTVCDKRKLSGRHFIHYDSERVDIAARIYLFSARLLGTYIINGSDRLIGNRHSFGILKLGNAEVHHLYSAVFKKHYILRLYIAVDDSL